MAEEDLEGDYTDGLYDKIKQLRTRIAELEAENADLKAEIAKLTRIAQDDAEVIGG